ncbi:unnamed protein product [Urochloa decumbens]|uniref:DUF1618 domain-containing protein n=1 Tax=Urochloa decumbens TaxID=240449 RepID=A0ABC8Y8F3_9POAL
MSRSSGSPRVAGPPAWIILDTEAVIADRRNATTASARTSTGEDIQVTLFAADPPRDSYFCVHCPGVVEADEDGAGGVKIRCSHGDLALLSVKLPGGGARHANTSDYFIYKAGLRPSLLLLQDIFDDPYSPMPLNDDAPIGILPYGGGGDEHFILAALRIVDKGTYKIYVFRSDRGAWASAMFDLGSEVCLEPLEKVIALGGSELGWVNLRKGILVCDVLGETPELRFIPLPKLLPTNQYNLWRQRPRYPREYRDVVVSGADGSIRCVEMEHQVRRVLPEMPDVSGADVLFDSDLPVGGYSYDDTPPPVQTAATSGWWRKEHLVHVDDILASDPDHASLLREMLAGDDQDGSDPALTLASLLMDVPSLSVDGGDVVYIMAKVGDMDTKTWSVAVDMERQALVEVAPVSVEGYDHYIIIRSNYLSCVLSRYLQTD